MASFSSYIFLIMLFIISVGVSEIKSIYLPGTYQSSLLVKKHDEKTKIPFKTHYFPQILDHFTFLPKSCKVFYQKYLINDQYWNKDGGGPIFVYTGNEGNIDWFAANTGFMIDIVPNFNALLIFIEVCALNFTLYYDLEDNLLCYQSSRKEDSFESLSSEIKLYI